MSREAPIPQPEPAEQQQRLEEVIAEYLGAVEAGQEPDRERLIDEHPDLADELREFFANQDRMQRIAAPVRNLAERALRIRCSHCGNRVQLLIPQLPEATCVNCGSSFRVESAAPCPPEKLPRTIGRYQVQALLGRGGFGDVYKAHDPKMERLVAVKVPRDGYFKSPEEQVRFVREPRTAAGLKHAGIVQVYNIAEEHDPPYIVSEYVEGLTLSDLLDGGLPTFRESAELVARLAEALDYAHREKVIHRDIKPSNILLDSSGRPHLTDFGLARRDEAELTVTLDGQVLGTLAYMSPEQATGANSKVDARSDIYSLGVVLYNLLTGELPFRGNPRMLLHQVLNDEPRTPRSLNDRVPRDLETICLKVMAKEPRRRYQSARELAEDLHRWAVGEPILARRTSQITRLLLCCKRNPMTTTAILTGGAAIIAVVIGAHAALVSNDLREAYQRTEKARRTSERLRNTLEVALEDAEDAKENEVRAHEATEQQRTLTAQALAKSQAFDYFFRIASADRARHTNDLAAAQQFLESCPVALRNWEWDYLSELCSTEPSRFAQHESAVIQLALAPSSKHIASVTSDGAVRLWDAESQIEYKSFSNAESDVRCATFDSEGGRLAIGHTNGVAKIWQVTNKAPKLIRSMKMHATAVSSIVFSHCGTYVATTSTDKTVKLAEITTGKTLLELKHPGNVKCLAFSRKTNGSWLVREAGFHGSQTAE